MKSMTKFVWWVFFYVVLFLIASIIVYSPIGIFRHPERMSEMEILVVGFCEFILHGFGAFHMVSKGQTGILKRAGYTVAILIVLVLSGFVLVK